MMNSPAEVAKIYSDVGAGKTKLPTVKCLLLAFLAGMYIALAGVGATIAGVTVESASIGKILGACVFPAGLAMVLIAGSELFTGNCLIVISVLEKKATLAGMLRNWVLVYIGNMVGGIFIAWMVVYGHTCSLFGNGYAQAAANTALAKVNLTFSEGLIRGILCNVLVCLGVWMAFAAKDVAGKIVGLFFPIMVFVLSGFEHCVANMYYIPAGIFANAEYQLGVEGLTWGKFFINNLIPVTLGNIIGGGVLIGCVYWVIYLKDAKK